MLHERTVNSSRRSKIGQNRWKPIMKTYSLYKHTNKLNGKIYIGITNDVNRRWRNDGIEYKPEEGRVSHFWNAINKYGWNNFEHQILKHDLSFKQACELEKEYIKLFDSDNSKFGYNIAPGGNGGRIYQKHPKGMLGKHQTVYEKEVHKNMMLDHSKNPMTNGTVKWGVNHEHPKGMLGKHQSEHHKEVMRMQKGNKNPNSKGLRIVFPNGNEEYWPTLKYFIQNGGFYKVYKLVKSSEPYVVDINHVKKTDKKKCEKYLGCVFMYQ